MLGTFIKELRARRRHGLRDFCLEHGHDPSHWSKIEREVLPPPRDEETLRTWAKQLGLKPNTDDWLKFSHCAAADAGRIPDNVMKDEELLGKLPVSFRTLSGQKPSREDLEKLLEIIRCANDPSNLREPPAIPTGSLPTKPRSTTSPRGSRQPSKARRNCLLNYCARKHFGHQVNPVQ